MDQAEKSNEEASTNSKDFIKDSLDKLHKEFNEFCDALKSGLLSDSEISTTTDGSGKDFGSFDYKSIGSNVLKTNSSSSSSSDSDSGSSICTLKNLDNCFDGSVINMEQKDFLNSSTTAVKFSDSDSDSSPTSWKYNEDLLNNPFDMTTDEKTKILRGYEYYPDVVSSAKCTDQNTKESTIPQTTDHRFGSFEYFNIAIQNVIQFHNRSLESCAESSQFDLNFENSHQDLLTEKPSNKLKKGMDNVNIENATFEFSCTEQRARDIAIQGYSYSNNNKDLLTKRLSKNQEKATDLEDTMHNTAGFSFTEQKAKDIASQSYSERSHEDLLSDNSTRNWEAGSTLDMLNELSFVKQIVIGLANPSLESNHQHLLTDKSSSNQRKEINLGNIIDSTKRITKNSDGKSSGSHNKVPKEDKDHQIKSHLFKEDPGIFPENCFRDIHEKFNLSDSELKIAYIDSKFSNDNKKSALDQKVRIAGQKSGVDDIDSHDISRENSPCNSRSSDERMKEEKPAISTAIHEKYSEDLNFDLDYYSDSPISASGSKFSNPKLKLSDNNRDTNSNKQSSDDLLELLGPNLMTMTDQFSNIIPVESLPNSENSNTDLLPFDSQLCDRDINSNKQSNNDLAQMLARNMIPMIDQFSNTMPVESLPKSENSNYDLPFKPRLRHRSEDQRLADAFSASADLLPAESQFLYDASVQRRSPSPSPIASAHSTSPNMPSEMIENDPDKLEDIFQTFLKCYPISKFEIPPYASDNAGEALATKSKADSSIEPETDAMSAFGNGIRQNILEGSYDIDSHSTILIEVGDHFSENSRILCNNLIRDYLDISLKVNLLSCKPVITVAAEDYQLRMGNLLILFDELEYFSAKLVTFVNDWIKQIYEVIENLYTGSSIFGRGLYILGILRICVKMAEILLGFCLEKQLLLEDHEKALIICRNSRHRLPGRSS